MSIPIRLPINKSVFKPEDYLDIKICRASITHLRDSKTLYYLYQYVKDENGDTILHLAAKTFHKNGCLSVIIDELSRNAKESWLALVNKTNYFGNTALMDASRTGQYPAAKLLVDHGADINICNKNGNTAAHIAALNGHQSILKLLLDKKVNVLAKNCQEFTCFDLAE